MPLKCHENICVFYDRLPTYNSQKEAGHKPYETKGGTAASENYRKGLVRTKSASLDGTRYPRDVLRFKGANNPHNMSMALHPTQKPTALCEYLVKTYTNPGELVLDNCMGSGTTAVAAINTGRHFIGFEKEREYYEIAIRRIEQAYAQTRLAL